MSGRIKLPVATNAFRTDLYLENNELWVYAHLLAETRAFKKEINISLTTLVSLMNSAMFGEHIKTEMESALKGLENKNYITLEYIDEEIGEYSITINNRMKFAKYCNGNGIYLDGTIDIPMKELYEIKNSIYFRIYLYTLINNAEDRVISKPEFAILLDLPQNEATAKVKGFIENVVNKNSVFKHLRASVALGEYNPFSF